MFVDLLPWILFLAFVFVMLALDLGVFHRHAHVVHRREALIWSGVWIGLAIVFNIGVYGFQGSEKGLEWTTGYLIEKSLSVDNVFLFILIFSAFHVPDRYQHRVLFWGIVGALLMRGALIAAGAAVLTWFHFAIYVFGAFLIVTGLKFLRDTGEHAPSLDKNVLVRLARRVWPVSDSYAGQQFFVRRNGILMMTPLFLVLLLVESTDVIFAIDSIPAIYAITEDPFIVFTSNVFAILGLRALYFVLNGYLSGMAYLKPALAAILVFVGTKMMLTDVYKIDSLISLGVIATILVVAVGASLVRKPSSAARGETPPVVEPITAGEGSLGATTTEIPVRRPGTRLLVLDEPLAHRVRRRLRPPRERDLVPLLVAAGCRAHRLDLPIECAATIARLPYSVFANGLVATAAACTGASLLPGPNE